LNKLLLRSKRYNKLKKKGLFYGYQTWIGNRPLCLFDKMKVYALSIKKTGHLPVSAGRLEGVGRAVEKKNSSTFWGDIGVFPKLGCTFVRYKLAHINSGSINFNINIVKGYHQYALIATVLSHMYSSPNDQATPKLLTSAQKNNSLSIKSGFSDLSAHILPELLKKSSFKTKRCIDKNTGKELQVYPRSLNCSNIAASAITKTVADIFTRAINKASESDKKQSCLKAVCEQKTHALLSPALENYINNTGQVPRLLYTRDNYAQNGDFCYTLSKCNKWFTQPDNQNLSAKFLRLRIFMPSQHEFLRC
jgi:hypothetical protein